MERLLELIAASTRTFARRARCGAAARIDAAAARAPGINYRFHEP